MLRTLSVLVMALVVSLLAAPLLAQQRDWQARNVDREFDEDRFIAGGSLWITQPVRGNLLAAGGNVDIAAPIGGSAALVGGTVRVAAGIAQSLYAAAGTVKLEAPVEHHARIAAGTVEIGPQASVRRNVSIVAGDIRVVGSIGGYLQAGGGHVFIDGPIQGDVEIATGSIELGPNARIGGRLRYASREELIRDPAAQVQGGIERFTPRGSEPPPQRVEVRTHTIAGWLWSVGLALIAAVLVAVLPALYADVTTTVRTRWAWSVLVGFIALICIPVAALILMFTLIGIPLGVAAIVFYVLLLFVGYVSAGIGIGQAVLQRLQASRAARTAWRVLAAVLGVLAVSLLGRVPWVGGFVVFAAMLLGIGALLLQAGPRRTLPFN
jgi:cytoskeletal protein CcmA (bactofilin family)